MKRADRAAYRRAAKPGHGWALLVLGIAVFLAYSNSFRAGLIFDNAILFSDARVQTLTAHNVWRIFTEGYWINDPATGLYRPFTTLSFLLNSAIFGGEPAGYHWVNLALHEINVAMIYALGMLIFARRAPAFAMALLWGLHPLHVEAVTNVVGRADLLAAMGVLGGLLCYAQWQRAAEGRRLLWAAGVAAASALGIFSKESAVVLPVILLAYDSMAAHREAWRKRALPYAAALIPVAVYLCLRMRLRIHMVTSYVDNPIVRANFFDGRMTALHVLGKLTLLFFWPVRLSADYSYNAIPVWNWQSLGWEEALALPAAFALIAATWYCVRKKRTAPALYFFPLFFWIAYLPTSNLPFAIGSIMAERFLYLPSIGLAGWAVAAAMAMQWKAPAGLRISQRAGWAAAAAVCIAFGIRTYLRNFDWTDERSLWSSAVAAAPGSARAHNNLGTALPLERLPDMIAEFEAAVRIRPDFAEAHNNLGNALAHMPGRLPEAVLEYQAAVRLRPDYAEAHANLGNALLQLPGRAPDAISEFRTVAALRPDDAAARISLGSALLETPGGRPQAIAEFQAALRLHPEDAEAHYNLGNALMRVPDQLPQAIEQFEAAIRARPDFAEAHYNLGNALLRVPDKTEEAVNQYRTALQIAPDLAEGHYNLARALLRFPGSLPDAIAELETAVRLKPEFAEAHYNLAMLLRQVPGREGEVSKELATAVRLRPEFGRLAGWK